MTVFGSFEGPAQVSVVPQNLGVGQGGFGEVEFRGRESGTQGTGQGDRSWGSLDLLDLVGSI